MSDLPMEENQADRPRRYSSARVTFGDDEKRNKRKKSLGKRGPNTTWRGGTRREMDRTTMSEGGREKLADTERKKRDISSALAKEESFSSNAKSALMPRGV